VGRGPEHYGEEIKLEHKHAIAFALEMDLAQMIEKVNVNKKFSPLAKYPAISRDISIVLKENVSVKDIIQLIKDKGQGLS